MAFEVSSSMKVVKYENGFLLMYGVCWEVDDSKSDFLLKVILDQRTSFSLCYNLFLACALIGLREKYHLSFLKCMAKRYLWVLGLKPYYHKLVGMLNDKGVVFMVFD